MAAYTPIGWARCTLCEASVWTKSKVSLVDLLWRWTKSNYNFSMYTKWNGTKLPPYTTDKFNEQIVVFRCNKLHKRTRLVLSPCNYFDDSKTDWNTCKHGQPMFDNHNSNNNGRSESLNFHIKFFVIYWLFIYSCCVQHIWPLGRSFDMEFGFRMRTKNVVNRVHEHWDGTSGANMNVFRRQPSTPIRYTSKYNELSRIGNRRQCRLDTRISKQKKFHVHLTVWTFDDIDDIDASPPHVLLFV